MFLKNKWKNLSVKKKLFIWSSLIITIAFTFLYICIYFFMPRVYEFYKVNSVKSGIEELKRELQVDEDIDIDELLDKFSYSNNINSSNIRHINFTMFKRILLQEYSRYLN